MREIDGGEKGRGEHPKGQGRQHSRDEDSTWGRGLHALVDGTAREPKLRLECKSAEGLLAGRSNRGMARDAV
jgi:hypothetical protein